MATRLRVVAKGWAELSAHLFQGDGREHAAFLPARFVRHGNDVEVLALNPILIPDEELVGGAEEDHLELSPQAMVRAVNEAVALGVDLVEVHNHGPKFQARFSPRDHAGFTDVVPYMCGSLPGKNYGALVLGGRENVDGLVWMGDANDPSPIEVVEVLGSNRLVVPTTHQIDACEGIQPYDEDLARFDRQVRAWGADGQRELGKLRVAIAGLGGLGSVVLEELVQSGVRRFVLIDFDVVEDTNLTRVALIRPRDIGRSKVEALRDHVLDLAPDADVVVVPDSVYSERAIRELAASDIIIGCTDDSGTRFALNEASLRSLRPLLDMGSQIHTNKGKLGGYGGRFTFAVPGEGCLLCANAIDVREASSELRPKASREAESRVGYIDGSSERAPAVRSLNGVVASLGVLELQAWGTGMRPMKPQTFFDGATGEATRLEFSARRDCVSCRDFLAAGIDAMPERYRCVERSA